MAEVIFTVTVPGGTGGGYYIDGVQKPIVPVVTGGTFRFNQNAASNNFHPLALSTTTSIAGRITTGVVYYLDGISSQADYYNVTLFNAATVRYIEITVTQTSDFYYLCNVHGFSMGNNMDVTVDTWGALSWNAGSWEEQNNVYLIISGQQISTSQGAVYAGENNAWGQFTWGFNEWNDLINPNVILTGNQLNTSVGNEEAFTNVSLTLSTNLISTSINSVSLVGGALEEPIGIQINSTINSVFAGENVIVELTTPGTFTEWGSLAWGQGAWNQISGVQTLQGDESISGTGIVNLTGLQSNTSTGTFTVTADANLSLNTNIISVSVGNVLVVVGAFVQLTAPGNLPWGSAAWNDGSWGNIGGMFISQGAEEEAVPSVEVNVSGNSLILTLTSTTVIANANVTPNNNLLISSLGNEDVTPNTIVTLSTNSISITQGSASGQVLTLVPVTGVNMTSSTGRLFIAAWAVVDIGVTNTWSVVDIAA